ncbi:MAG: thioesterase family protein [Anaerolineales bacterium]|jgi:predicted thioesterase
MSDDSVRPGLVLETEQEVTPDLTAPHLGSGTLRVYATPAMSMLIEDTCRRLVDPLLAEGETTVGVAMELRHLAPTPVGGKVHLRVEVSVVEGNIITFQARLWDDVEPIGEAEHKRAVIQVERFLARVQAKTARAEGKA